MAKVRGASGKGIGMLLFHVSRQETTAGQWGGPGVKEEQVVAAALSEEQEQMRRGRISND